MEHHIAILGGTRRRRVRILIDRVRGLPARQGRRRITSDTVRDQRNHRGFIHVFRKDRQGLIADGRVRRRQAWSPVIGRTQNQRERVVGSRFEVEQIGLHDRHFPSGRIDREGRRDIRSHAIHCGHDRVAQVLCGRNARHQRLIGVRRLRREHEHIRRIVLVQTHGARRRRKRRRVVQVVQLNRDGCFRGQAGCPVVRHRERQGNPRLVGLVVDLGRIDHCHRTGRRIKLEGTTPIHVDPRTGIGHAHTRQCVSQHVAEILVGCGEVEHHIAILGGTRRRRVRVLIDRVRGLSSRQWRRGCSRDTVRHQRNHRGFVHVFDIESQLGGHCLRTVDRIGDRHEERVTAFRFVIQEDTRLQHNCRRRPSRRDRG